MKEDASISNAGIIYFTQHPIVHQVIKNLHAAWARNSIQMKQSNFIKYEAVKGSMGLLYKRNSKKLIPSFYIR